VTVYLDQHGGVALWVIAVCAVLLVLLVLAIWIRLDGVTSEWRVDRQRPASGHDESARPQP
jgi:hypothetical protein